MLSRVTTAGGGSSQGRRGGGIRSAAAASQITASTASCWSRTSDAPLYACSSERAAGTHAPVNSATTIDRGSPTDRASGRAVGSLDRDGPLRSDAHDPAPTRTRAVFRLPRHYRSSQSSRRGRHAKAAMRTFASATMFSSTAPEMRSCDERGGSRGCDRARRCRSPRSRTSGSCSASITTRRSRSPEPPAQRRRAVDQLVQVLAHSPRSRHPALSSARSGTIAAGQRGVEVRHVSHRVRSGLRTPSSPHRPCSRRRGS